MYRHAPLGRIRAVSDRRGNGPPRHGASRWASGGLPRSQRPRRFERAPHGWPSPLASVAARLPTPCRARAIRFGSARDRGATARLRRTARVCDWPPCSGCAFRSALGETDPHASPSASGMCPASGRPRRARDGRVGVLLTGARPEAARRAGLSRGSSAAARTGSWRPSSVPACHAPGPRPRCPGRRARPSRSPWPPGRPDSGRSRRY